MSLLPKQTLLTISCTACNSVILRLPRNACAYDVDGPLSVGRARGNVSTAAKKSSWNQLEVMSCGDRRMAGMEQVMLTSLRRAPCREMSLEILPRAVANEKKDGTMT